MNYYEISVTVLAVLLIAMLIWQRHDQSKEIQTQRKSWADLMEMTRLENSQSLKQMTEKMSELQSKAMSLLAAGDPLAFQQIQAMQTLSTYDEFKEHSPSDAADIERIQKRDQTEEEVGGLSGYEQGIYDEYGLDAFFSADQAT